jgi:hypothetical protein
VHVQHIDAAVESQGMPVQDFSVYLVRREAGYIVPLQVPTVFDKLPKFGREAGVGHTEPQTRENPQVKAEFDAVSPGLLGIGG